MSVKYFSFFMCKIRLAPGNGVLIANNSCNSVQIPLIKDDYNQLSEMDFDYYHFPDKKPSANPIVSVIVSTYNRFRSQDGCDCLLKRALESILNQTFTDFELILIDDFSPDNSKEYCIETAKKDPRVHFYHFKKNSGWPAKRYNFGISRSKGRYLTFMFDDDQWELSALHDLFRAIEGEYKNCALVYGQAAHYRSGELTPYGMLGGKWNWNSIIESNFIANNSVIVKKEAIDLVGGYSEDPAFSRVCDWDLWWRIGRKFKVGSITNRVANVFSELPDSIRHTKSLNLEECKRLQRLPRRLPLQVGLKEPWQCKIQSALFDAYLTMISTRSKLIAKLKAALRKVLPNNMYEILRILNKRLRSLRRQGE